MSQPTPVIAQRSPIEVSVRAGESYWWCACGKSASQPFCDGSHKGSGMAPVEYTPLADGVVWFCACKHTSTKPMCDGTHNRI